VTKFISLLHQILALQGLVLVSSYSFCSDCCLLDCDDAV